MKKEKLKLNELKVQSFVTALAENDKGTVNGGDVVVKSYGGTCWQGCVGPIAPGTDSLGGVICVVMPNYPGTLSPPVIQ